MGFLEEISEKVIHFAADDWGHIPAARVPPTPEELTFSNSAERLSVCVLYADLRRSTEMVDTIPDTLAAAYYKAFLHCAAKIIRRNNGTIQAYDGDRVMGIYVGDDKEKNSVVTALELNWAMANVINHFFSLALGNAHRELQHTVGIDAGNVLVAKTGVRVDSDLVWVGPAANYAAKFNSFNGLDITYPTRISRAVFDRLPGYLRIHNGIAMWEGPYRNFGQGPLHLRSNYSMAIPRTYNQLR